MKSKTVVLFEKGQTPRIFKNPKSLSKLQERGPILVNPSLPKGVPPHLWRLVNGKIHTGGIVGTVFNRKEVLPENQTGYFKPIVILALALLLSVRIYENKEKIKTLPGVVVSFFASK